MYKVAASLMAVTIIWNFKDGEGNGKGGREEGNGGMEGEVYIEYLVARCLSSKYLVVVQENISHFTVTK